MCRVNIEMIYIMSAAASFRVEKDLLGTLEVPADAYYGIQTLRAANNFHLSGVPLSHYPKLVVGLAMVKQAAADANRELGHLSDAKHPGWRRYVHQHERERSHRQHRAGGHGPPEG